MYITWRYVFSQIPEVIFSLQITVTDMGMPKLSSVMHLAINVGDINDHAPQFTHDEYAFDVSFFSFFYNNYFNFPDSNKRPLAQTSSSRNRHRIRLGR